MTNMHEIFSYFPKRIGKALEDSFSKGSLQDGITLLEEIRIRSGKPVIMKYSNLEQILENIIPLQEEILETLQCICNNSIYSYQNQICNGFITLKGGHRVRNNRKCCFSRRKSYKYKLHIKLKFSYCKTNYRSKQSYIKICPKHRRKHSIPYSYYFSSRSTEKQQCYVIWLEKLVVEWSKSILKVLM